MLTSQEIEEFHLTQEEIDAVCEGAVESALENNASSSKYVATDGGIIPLLRAYPWF